MTTMRAKMKVVKVESYKNDSGDTTLERLTFTAVCKDSGYPSDGTDEDNTFAKWTPSADLTLSVTNPNLFGKFEKDQKYYLDFTQV